METLEVQAPDGHLYTVSFSPLREKLNGRMSHEVQQRYQHLVEKAQENPKAAFLEVEAFAKEQEAFPEVLNLFTFVLAQTKRVKRVEELIAYAYEKHPDYFFARVNFADQCLRKKKLDRFAEVFPSLSPRDICPEQKVFHASQLRGLMVLFGFYKLARKEDATPFLTAAKAIEPMHISVLLLERKIKRKQRKWRAWFSRR